jgi:hypothetical protein
LARVEQAAVMNKDSNSHPDAVLVRRRALRDRRTSDVIELLTRRRELVGLNPWADHVIESVAWTA